MHRPLLVHFAAMLRFNQLSLRRGPRLLFSAADFSIHPGQKVGLTGANGCGKSSLFALVRGELSADAGKLDYPADWVIAWVDQETPASAQPALEYVIAGDSELQQVSAELAVSETAGDGEAQARLHAHLDTIDAYRAPSRAGRLLHGLGFTPEQEQWPVQRFSGGWRMRLNLARALMCRSDLLMLDEPTNHLDLDAVLWLEDWLCTYSGTLMLISHDRDFLDRVVGQIAHLEQERITLYAGNYSDFERCRAEALSHQQSAYEKQQWEIAHMHRFVERFRAKATKARQAQSRLKALQRMEEIAPAHVDSPFHFSFPPPDKLPSPLLRLEQVSAGYEHTPILRDIELGLMPEDRIGLVGHNGAGKSTLIKLLAGEMSPLAGECHPARSLNCGYFAQHQLEQLRATDSPLQHLQRLAPGSLERDLRDFLGGFGFGGSRADSPVAPFSGGEKARLVLALLVYQRPNLLLLDEPTNHLDLEMRHALTMALQEYQGALVVVSHDRHLLRSVTDTLWLVDEGCVSPFAGDLEDYRRWLTQGQAPAPTDTLDREVELHSATARKQRRQQEAQKRLRLQPLQAEVTRLEREVHDLEQQDAACQTILAEPEMYTESQKARLQQTLQNQARIRAQLEAAEVAWMAAMEALDAGEKGL